MKPPKVFFREGVENEDPSDVETKLIEVAEAKEKLEGLLEQVIDISNTDVEAATEVSEESPKVIQYAVALRTQYEELKTILAAANAETQRLKVFESEVLKMVEGDNTKLAESIKKLKPNKDG